MLDPTPVTALDLPELAPYRTLRRAEEHRRAGLFVAESEKVVTRLLESPIEVVSFLLTPAWLERLSGAIEERASPAPVYLAEAGLLERIVGVRLHQGVMAVAKVPEPPPLATTLAAARPAPLLVALDGVTNPENLGVIARVAAAFSAAALVAGETSGSPWLRRAVRASMGTVFRTPVHEVADLVGTLRWLRARGTEVVGASPAGTVPAAGTLGRGACCVVLGHEDRGLRREVEAECDGLVAIPMAAGVDSLNVGSAAAILLWEARRSTLPASTVSS